MKSKREGGDGGRSGGRGEGIGLERGGDDIREEHDIPSTGNRKYKGPEAELCLGWLRSQVSKVSQEVKNR